MLLGYLQASIAKMQDHRKPSLTILDFRLETKQGTRENTGLFSSQSKI
jgi:hypothetical protein